jgi:hypothetical protein
LIVAASIPQVRVGRWTLTLAQAVELRATIDPTTAAHIAEASQEQTFLWNAIQRADKLAKGLPLRPINYRPEVQFLLDAAEARLERRIAETRFEADRAAA